MIRIQRSTSRRAVLSVVGSALAAGCVGAPRVGFANSDDSDTSGETNAKIDGDSVWRMFAAGPSHTSYNPDASGPSDGASEMWSHTCAEERGDILGTPVIADRTVYVGCGHSVEAFDATTGKHRWSRRLGPVNRFSPALDSKSVFVTVRGENRGLYSLLRDSGEIRWRIRGRVVSAPVYHDGRVYARTGDHDTLSGFDASDGSEAWTYTTDCVASGWSPPTVADGTVYFLTACDDNSALHALDPATGNERWRLTLSGMTSRSAPAVVDGFAYYGGDDGALHAVDVAAREEAWRADVGGQLWTTPTVGNGRVFIGSITGDLSAFDARDGERTWRTKTGIAYETTAFDGDTLYTGGKYVTALDPETGSVRWQFDRRDTYHSQFASPAVVGGIVLATSCVKITSNQVKYDNRIYALA